MAESFAVIGGGPAGYAVAIKLAKAGRDVALFEERELGGTCLNRGCIPTKTLISSSRLLSRMNRASEFGIKVAGAAPDLAAMIDRKDGVVAVQRDGVRQQVDAAGVRLISGKATFTAPNVVAWRDGEERFDSIIIASGSEPRFLPPFSPGMDGVLTSDDALGLRDLPASLTIIGGGVIGCEFASFFLPLGVRMIIVDLADRLLATEDKRVSVQYRGIMQKAGIALHLGRTVAACQGAAGAMMLTLDDGTKVESELVLLAAGRGPATAELGLAAVGIESDVKGFILTDDAFNTNVPRHMAIGDCNGKVMLAHAASAQACALADALTGRKVPHIGPIPTVIFTDPEVASVGITPDDAAKRGLPVKIGKSSFAANGRALASGEAVGFVQLVAGEDGVLLGAQMMGPEASELIHELVLAISLGLTAEALADSVHAHPTLSETVAVAASSLC